MAERRTIKTIGIIGIAAILIWVMAAFGLPILLPFLLGYLAAKAAEPLVRRMEEHSSLPRWICSGICVAVLLLLFGVILFLLGKVLVGEVVNFTRRLPVFLVSLSEPLQNVRQWLTNLAQRAPDGLGTALQGWVDRLFESGSLLAEKAYEVVFSAASNFISSLPDVLLFAVTTVLASFMTSSRLPALRKSLKKRLPKKWLERSTEIAARLKSAMGGWLKAQLTLMGITFGILTVGFLLLRVEFALLFAGLIALIDALPIFGTGTVLIPWALVSFLQGDTTYGIGLLILYGVAALTRTSLEPRFIGKQIGLNPLVTLLAMYAGFRLCGIGGMILFPVGAILLRQFLELLDKTGVSKKE